MLLDVHESNILAMGELCLGIVPNWVCMQEKSYGESCGTQIHDHVHGKICDESPHVFSNPNITL